MNHICWVNECTHMCMLGIRGYIVWNISKQFTGPSSPINRYTLHILHWSLVLRVHCGSLHLRVVLCSTFIVIWLTPLYLTEVGTYEAQFESAFWVNEQSRRGASFDFSRFIMPRTTCDMNSASCISEPFTARYNTQSHTETSGTPHSWRQHICVRNKVKRKNALLLTSFPKICITIPHVYSPIMSEVWQWNN